MHRFRSRASRRAGATLALLVLLLAGASCQSGSETAARLEERLKEMAQHGRPNATPDEIEQALARELRVAPVPAKGSNRPSSPAFPTRRTLRDFYAGRQQRLAWCDDTGRLLPAAGTLLEALRAARDQGLDPEDYALSRLERLRGEMKEKPEKAVNSWADFDLLMTTAFFRYASDLSTGRVHPDEIHSEWHTQPPELDLPGALAKALQDGSLEQLLKTLPPPHPGYAQLQAGLKKLRDIEAGGGWVVVPNGPKLQTGARGPRVALLKQRLSDTGAGQQPPAQDAVAQPAANRPGRPAPPRARSAPVPPAGAGAVFDEALAQSVRRFQALHGMEPDGIVSATTLAELNVPVDTRIREVELNLERWRWIPRRLGNPHVEVNIPGFRLQLIQDGRVELESRIVVGQAFTPTPVFTDRIVAVIANPPWNVPDQLAVREYLPELKEDPQIFAKHGIRIFDSAEKGAREVDPASVRWRGVDEDEFHYHLRQDPGPDNALGRMKFQLTNDFQIYLHDTPARELFGKADRDLSHGCIRVEKAGELADRILGDASDKLAEALESEDEKQIQVRPPVPIQILYLTAWADPDGTLHFAPDIYEFDLPQQDALKRVSRATALPASPARN